MCRSPDAARPHIDFARVGLRISDELGNRSDWKRWMHLHHEGHADDPRDRCDVADEIVIESLVKRHVDQVRRIGQEERMTVGWRTYNQLGADLAISARPVLDEEALPEPLR